MVESGRPAWLVWDAPPFEGGEGWTPERVDGYLAALLRELLRTKNDVRCQGASALSEMHLSAALSDAEERIDEMIDVTVAMRELRQPSEWSGRVCKPRVDQWVSRINVHNPFIDPTERPGPARSEPASISHLGRSPASSAAVGKAVDDRVGRKHGLVDGPRRRSRSPLWPRSKASMLGGPVWDPGFQAHEDPYMSESEVEQSGMHAESRQG